MLAVVAINTAIIPYAQGVGLHLQTRQSCTDDTYRGAKKPWLNRWVKHNSANRTLLTCLLTWALVLKADGSPSEKAGMADGDIILQIDNVELRRIEDLVAHVRKRKVGEPAKILALRDGREYFFEVKLRETP
jgi:S1-C subfamily serine protease